MKKFTEVEPLVDDMLDRFERNGPGRILAHIGVFRSTAHEDDFEAKLRALERSGGLTVRRDRIDGVHRIRHVAMADAASLYAFRRRNPSHSRAASALSSLRAAYAKSPSTIAILDEVAGNWSRGVGWNGVSPERHDVLEQALLVVEALHRQQHEKLASVDARTFSRRAVGDTKFLERRLSLIASLYRRLHPGHDDLALEDAEYLACLGVQKTPQPLLIGGPLLIDGQRMPFLPFVGLPPDQVNRIGIGDHRYVLTIENYASFVRHCTEANADGAGLVIYTAGFPPRQVLAAIVTLAGRSHAPIYHWGDIDRGGLRIFLHLERAVARVGKELRPHLMDHGIIERFGISCDFGVGRLPDHAVDSRIAELWKNMANEPSPKMLEQEALDPVSPLSN